MEYRKYGLSTISQAKIKERKNMTYSKTTDEVVRELNDFIAQAKDAAERARKCEVEIMLPFWNLIADKTDNLTESIHRTLSRVSVISEHPDEITNRFAIIKVIEDAAFELNIILNSASITVARNLPQFIEPQKPLCDLYQKLAHDSALKSIKIVDFMNELAVLIFDDMRKTAAEKIQVVVQEGKRKASSITGYDYIKNEITYLIEELERKALDDITVSWLDDTLFKLRVISFAAETDVCRMPTDSDMLDISELISKLNDAFAFMETVAIEEKPVLMEQSDPKFFMDIAYQGNIMLFYLRGEIEKLTGAMIDGINLLCDEQKATFESICDKLNIFIQLAYKATDGNAVEAISDTLHSIQSGLTTLSGELKDNGGAVRYINEELGRLAEIVERYCNR